MQNTRWFKVIFHVKVFIDAIRLWENFAPETLNYLKCSFDQTSLNTSNYQSEISNI